MSETDEAAVWYETAAMGRATLDVQLAWLLDHRWTIELSTDASRRITLRLRRYALSATAVQESRIDEVLLIKEQATIGDAVLSGLAAGRVAERVWEEGIERVLAALPQEEGVVWRAEGRPA